MKNEKLCLFAMIDRENDTRMCLFDSPNAAVNIFLLTLSTGQQVGQLNSKRSVYSASRCLLVLNLFCLRNDEYRLYIATYGSANVSQVNGECVACWQM